MLWNKITNKGVTFIVKKWICLVTSLFCICGKKIECFETRLQIRLKQKFIMKKKISFDIGDSLNLRKLSFIIIEDKANLYNK